MSRLFSAFMALLLIFAQGANLQARSNQSHKSGVYSSRSNRSARTHTARHSSTRYHRSRIKRSSAAKHDFMRRTGYPHGRKGYVVDHVKPLACGGADAPSNMQWQTVAEAKAKDKIERRGCK